METKTTPVHPLLLGTTPGPWRSFDDAGSQMQSYSQNSGVAGTGENIGQLVAGCFHDIIGGKDQAAANAKLIAQAPSLAAENALLAEHVERLTKRLERIVSLCTPHVNTPNGKMTYSGPDLPERFAALSDEIMASLTPASK